MFNIGAFAGGLAQGIRSGESMALRQKQAERTAQADEREAEMQRARMGKGVFHKEKRNRLKAANDEIVEGWRQSNPQQPLRSAASRLGHPGPGPGAPVETGQIFKQSAGSFSAGGLESKIIPAAPTGNGLAGSTARAGLMSQYENPVARKNPDKARAATSDDMIGRRMLTGDLLENPDELTRMARIYKKHGLLKEMTPWMNSALEAKKKRIPDALPYLLTGDAKRARETLKKGGIDLIDEPVPANPENRQGHSWRFRLEGGGEQEIDLRELAESFFPEKYLLPEERG